MTRARDIADYSGGLVLLGTKTVASGSADTTSMQLNDVFSADYQNYRINFDIVVASDSGRGTTTGLFMGFGNSGTIRTSSDQWDGTIMYGQTNAVAPDSSFSSKAQDSAGIMGTFTTQGVSFAGYSIVRNPFSSSVPHEIETIAAMHYDGVATGQYPERSLCVTTAANFSTTDVNFQVATGIVTDNSGYNDFSTRTKVNLYGTFKVYGIKDSF
jgi:hypothetical protein